MRQVGGDTGGVDDIVEGELVNERGELEEQRQRLACRVSNAAFISTLGDTIPVQYRPRHRQQLSRVSGPCL